MTQTRPLWRPSTRREPLRPVTRVGAPRAVMQDQRVERPIRIGEHVNRAILTDKNGHLRAGLALGRRGFGSVEDGLGLFGEAHSFLIAKSGRDFCPIAELSVPRPRDG